MWTGCEAGSAAACTCPRPSQGHRAPQGPSLLLPVFLLPTRQVEMSPCSEIQVGLVFFAMYLIILSRSTLGTAWVGPSGAINDRSPHQQIEAKACHVA